MMMYIKPSLGNFTTPDLLWSAFPAQTPYQYAFNSPLTYRDPSGLAPEKEKEGEELMTIVPYDPFNDNFTVAMRDEINMLLSSAFYDPNRVSSYALAFGGGGGGGSSGGNRTAASYTPNGISFKTLNGMVVGVTYHYITHIPTSFGTKNVPTTVDDHNGNPKAYMDAFVSGINDILAANPRFFDHLWLRDISVKIMHSSKIEYKGQGGYAGLHGGFKGTNKSEITLAGDMLTGNKKWEYNLHLTKSEFFEPYQIIAHEFAHAIHFALAGDSFLGYDLYLQEDYAIRQVNQLRSFHGDPLRDVFSTTLLILSGSSTKRGWEYFIHGPWWKYQFRGY